LHPTHFWYFLFEYDTNAPEKFRLPYYLTDYIILDYRLPTDHTRPKTSEDVSVKPKTSEDVSVKNHEFIGNNLYKKSLFSIWLGWLNLFQFVF
jgi:hypothetical protein